MEIFGKLPEEIIINHIMPFAYKPQPANLLSDIRSFYTDFHLLDNYWFYYNTYCMYNDIIEFINLENLLVRHHNCKNLSGYDLTFYTISNFYSIIITPFLISNADFQQSFLITVFGILLFGILLALKIRVKSIVGISPTMVQLFPPSKEGGEGRNE